MNTWASSADVVRLRKQSKAQKYSGADCASSEFAAVSSMTLAVARFSSLLFLLLFLLFSPGDARKRLRVIRGYATSTMQFKNLALIRILYNGASVTVCTGSLVDLSHVLTAAHCKRTFEQRDANTSIQVRSKMAS